MDDKKKFAIKSYTLKIDGKEFGGKMYMIDAIIRALKLYEERYDGIVCSLSGSKTVAEIVDEMSKEV